MIKAGLNQRNSNQNSHVISKRASDMPKGSVMKMTGFAQRSDVSVEREIWVHDDTETGDLIRKFNLGVRYVDRWCCRESLKSKFAEEYGFWFVWIEGKAVKTKPRVQSRQACFKVGDGGANSCTFETDIELSIIGVLLMRNAEVRNYLTDGWNIQWEKNGSKDGALWHTRETNRWIRSYRANADSLCAVFEIWFQPSKCSAAHTKASWESWKKCGNGRWFQKQR